MPLLAQICRWIVVVTAFLLTSVWLVAVVEIAAYTAGGVPSADGCGATLSYAALNLVGAVGVAAGAVLVWVWATFASRGRGIGRLIVVLVAFAALLGLWVALGGLKGFGCNISR